MRYLDVVADDLLELLREELSAVLVAESVEHLGGLFVLGRRARCELLLLRLVLLDVGEDLLEVRLEVALEHRRVRDLFAALEVGRLQVGLLEEGLLLLGRMAAAIGDRLRRWRLLLRALEVDELPLVRGSRRPVLDVRAVAVLEALLRRRVRLERNHRRVALQGVRPDVSAQVVGPAVPGVRVFFRGPRQ